MVPGSPVLSDPELVGERIAWSYGALSDGIYSIMFKGIELTGTMHMNSCTVVSQMVLNSDFHPITPAGFEQWSRVLVIVNFPTRWAVNAISIDIFVCDIEMVLRNQSGSSFISGEITFRTIPIGAYSS